MAILGRILQFLLWLILAAWVVRTLARWISPKSAARDPRIATNPQAKSLHRDPVCGTYVAPEISLTLEQAGQVHHFCSPQCRERFLLSQRCAASG